MMMPRWHPLMAVKAYPASVSGGEYGVGCPSIWWFWLCSVLAVGGGLSVRKKGDK